MNFPNRWFRPITLGMGDTVCPLDLPDGSYRLTIAESLTDPSGRFEIVQAEVAAGQATLVRAREDTADQTWPEGSVIYAAMTAGLLAELFEQLETLKRRVEALEGEVGGVVPDGALTDGDGNILTDMHGNILVFGA